MSDTSVRPARAEDVEAAAALLYESAARMYDRYAGGGERALALLRRAFAEPGNNTSREVIWVAELGGRVAGALAAFPVTEIARRSGAFLRLTLRTIPVRRWPAALWLYRAGARAAPAPPRAALYVDALATDARDRRRGVATALLREVERHARAGGLATIALDTSLDNAPARSLYARTDYREVAHSPAGRSLPGFVALVKEL